MMKRRVFVLAAMLALVAALFTLSAFAAEHVRYVGNPVATEGGKYVPKGDGSTPDAPTTLEGAFEYFYNNFENAENKDKPTTIKPGETCTIYLVEDVMLTRLRNPGGAIASSLNTGYAEHAHENNPVRIESAPGGAKAAIIFPLTGVSGNETVLYYFLNGDTTFDNVILRVQSTNTASAIISARGHKLTLGAAVETEVDGSGKFVSVIGGLVNGGFYPTSVGRTAYDADVTVLSGEYDLICALNYTNVSVPVGTTAVLTLGDVTVGTLSATNFSGTVGADIEVNAYYTGKLQTDTFYLARMQTTDSRSRVFNHFLMKGSSLSEETLTAASVSNIGASSLNLYFDPSDSNAEASARSLYAKFATSVDSFVYGSLTDYELANGGHTVGADGKCTFCGVVPCESDGDHTPETVVIVEPTCNDGGKVYDRCSKCYATLSALRDGTPDPSKHVLTGAPWEIVDGKYVRRCLVCGEILQTMDGEATSDVYVSDAGFANGGLSAVSPINDYTAAMQMAIRSARALGVTEATIYLVGNTTFPLTHTDGNNYIYTEPAHEDIHITVQGYGSNAASFIFGGSYKAVSGSIPRLQYALGGATTFENIEFSSGMNTCPIYLIARHYHLTLGEHISCYFQRNVGGGEAHGGALTVVGGCYSSTCTKTDAHLTVKSGVYRNIITGSSGRSCGLENGTCTLELLGNVTTRESIFAGSSGGNAGDIFVTVDGDVVAARRFTFACSDLKDAKNSTVYLKSGSISTGSFNTLTGASQIIAPVGCANDSNILSGLSGTMTVYYDPTNPASVEMYRQVRLAPISGGEIAYELLSERCSGNPDGTHEPVAGSAVVTEATCFADGYTTYTCKHCGKLYTVAGEKSVHDFEANPVKNTAADCIHAGTLAYTCSKCGYTKYEIDSAAPATGVHSYGDDGVCTVCRHSVAADCAHEHLGEAYTETTKCGTVTKQKCGDCGLVITVASTGSHNWGAYTVTVEPTDTTPGVKTRKCKNCGKVETALLYANDTTLATDPVAVDQSGNLVDFAIESSKLTSSEKAALNALLQDTAYGSEVKVSYTTDGTRVTNVTYSIPLPDAYKDYENVKVIVKDDDGNLHTVDFKVEKGYIVFTF